MPKQLSPDVRDRILDAADRLLTRHGYAGTTISGLAEECGIGKGSVYLFFTSKEEVFLALIDRVVDAALEEVERSAGRQLPFADRLHHMLLARVLRRFDGFSHYSASLHDLLTALRPTMVRQREGHLSREAALLSGVIAQGQAAGELAPGDPDELARALLTATNSLLPYYLSPAELGDRAALERRTAAVAHLVSYGLVASPRPREAREPGDPLVAEALPR
jgi:AcrR family transcriptional regulator